MSKNRIDNFEVVQQGRNVNLENVIHVNHCFIDTGCLLGG